MRGLAAITLLLIVLMSISCSHRTRASTNKNTIFVLGSLHRYMLKNPKYSVKEFIWAIEQFKPDLILTETRPEFSGALEGAIDGGIEQGLIYAWGDFNRIPVMGVDWFDDDFISAMKKTPHNSSLENEVAPIYAIYERSFKEDSFEILQGKKTQSLIASIYATYKRHGQTLSFQRNEYICQNILNGILGLSGKRILVVFGLDHKYFIENYLEKESQNVVSLESFYNIDSTKFSFALPLKMKTLANLTEAKQLLEKRVAEGYYPKDETERLLRKVKEFDLWINYVEILN